MRKIEDPIKRSELESMNATYYRLKEYPEGKCVLRDYYFHTSNKVIFIYKQKELDEDLFIIHDVIENPENLIEKAKRLLGRRHE